MRRNSARTLRAGLLCALLAAGACIRDSRNLNAARETPARNPSAVTSSSWGLCRLLGPGNRNPGVYGSDLGFTAPQPGAEGALAVLFGDTWAEPVDGCRVPVSRSDDLLASLPAARPDSLRAGAPSGDAAAACKQLSYELADEQQPTSWARIRLFPNPIAWTEDSQFDMGEMRTPVAAFSSGEKLFAIFLRSDPAYCDRSTECPYDMLCSSDPAPSGAKLGMCAPQAIDGAAVGAPPPYCRSAEDCAAGVECLPAERGVCLARRPFTLRTERGPVAPRWYSDDPRRGLAFTMYLAAVVSPDRPSDFAVVQRFATHRFVNVAARAVAHFDPDDPDKNDYRPGTHTLLVWGRPSFFATGGAQTLPYLMYQPLDALRGEPDQMQWRPRFFAGYADDGKPRWSEHESEAQPIYGADATVTMSEAGPRIRWAEPEFDYVNQMSLSWVAPLSRWVMLYGGDLPAFLLLDPHTADTPDAVHLQPSPGAIHMRTAPHPWGRARGDRPAHEGWTSPQPVLTRRAAAPYLACGDGGPEELPGCVEDPGPHGPLDMLTALAELPRGEFTRVADRCIAGELKMAVQNELSGNPIGRLYAPNIIEEWTEDISSELPDLAQGGRAVELYWNVSTWNPYQVVLFKTQLRARNGGPSRPRSERTR